MTTPLATIADALIEFILSLLRDPAVAAQFAAEPDETLAEAGLSGVCAADVRAVVPVVLDRPDVVQRPVATQAPPMHPTYQPQVPGHHPVPGHPQGPAHPPTVVEEITNVTNNFTVDARTTIIDQSVNQNIWANGDVTQIFDQEAIVAAGDGSVAAGGNVLIDESTTKITTGDVAIGNTDITAEITDSFNDDSTVIDVDVTVAPDEPAPDLLPTDALADAGTADAGTTVEVLDAADPVVVVAVSEYEDTGSVLYDPAAYDVDGLDQP